MGIISGYNIASIQFDKFDNSFFKEFFDLYDPDSLTWALNILEKLYGEGILPKYVDRNKGDNLFEDEDLIAFLFTKTHFFGLLIKYVRLFEDIANNDILISEFLDNIALNYSTTQSSGELLYLLSNYIQEFNKRGTNNIWAKKGELNNIDIDGELLRLLNYTSVDEFIFALCSNAEVGWCLSHSSPTWASCSHINNLIKAYEFEESGDTSYVAFGDVRDLDKYPLVNDGVITLNSGVIRITNAPIGTPTGIGYNLDNSFMIVVDPKMNYEISFKVVLLSYTGTKPNIEFGLYAYDIYQLTPISLLDPLGTSPDNNFIDYTVPVTAKEYWIRGILWNKDYEFTDQEELNIGGGNNLKMTEDVNFIIPKILVNANSAASIVNLRQIAVRPLDLPFSLGQLGLKNLVINFRENKSGKPSEYIDSIIKNELMPYRTVYKPINIE